MIRALPGPAPARLPRLMAPLLMVRPPVKLFVPVNVRIELPSLVSPKTPPTCVIVPEIVTGLARFNMVAPVRKTAPLSPPPEAELITAPWPLRPVPASQTVFGMTLWRSRAVRLLAITNVWLPEPSAAALPTTSVPALKATLPVKPTFALLSVTTLEPVPVTVRLPPPESWPTSSSLIPAPAPRLIVPPAVPTKNCFVPATGFSVPEVRENVPPLRRRERSTPPAPSGPVAGSALL